ncbi:MAG: MATE family multidrug resistance protein [Flavobacteriales bacterium]
MNLKSSPNSLGDLSYRNLLSKAWPIILANASVPLLGLVDTAILGRYEDAAQLAALALVVVTFNFLYWGFGFLRMGTTGLIAFAHGKGDSLESLRIFIRSAVVALVISFVLILLSPFAFAAGMAFFSPSELAFELSGQYFFIRIFSAPASFLLFSISGVLIGLGASRSLLLMSIFLNTSNVLLDLLFAGFFGLGVEGLAWGTLVAEYSSVLVGVFLLYRAGLFGELNALAKVIRHVFAWHDMKAFFALNANLMVRTLFLLATFMWFTRAGAANGELNLAANHVLLQFVAFCAFFLDGFAHVLEPLVGRASANKDKKLFLLACKRTTILSVILAAAFAGFIGVFADDMLRLLLDDGQIVEKAILHVGQLSLYIVIAVWAFQLDGIYIGLAYGKALRNASILAAVGFYCIFEYGTKAYANDGLWWAFIAYAALRSLFLLLYWPSLLKRYF